MYCEMKPNATVRYTVAAIAFLFFAAAPTARACTGAYVGRGVSADGTTLLCRTVDTRPWTTCHRLNVTPRVENAPGRVYRGARNCKWDLPDTTWRFVSTPMLSSMKRGSFDSACANEKGVVFTGTVTGREAEWVQAADPFVKATGFGERALPGLLAQCCASARETVELLGRVVAAEGHDGPEIYMVADKDEAWYVEVYSGHQWAALRMPEDKVAVFGNQFMINSFNPSSPDAHCSQELVALAERNGKLVRNADGTINLRATYGAPLADYANMRTWYGHRIFAPDTAGEYETSREMPLFFAPARKIARRDVFELFRSRYEDTRFCPETSGGNAIRTIGTTKQASCHVISLDPRLPEQMRGTIWFTLANCEHCPYIPVNATATRFADAFAKDQEGDLRYDSNIAGMAFRRLCALAEQNRRWYGSGVRRFWRAREDELVAGWDAAMESRDPARLEAFSVAAQESALADARRIFDELMWYVVENNRIPGDGSGATAEPDKPFEVRSSFAECGNVAGQTLPEGAQKLQSISFAPYEGSVTNMHVAGESGAEYLTFDFVVRAAKGSEILCRMSMPPVERWDGRLWGQGHGGYAGSVWNLPAPKGHARVMCDLGMGRATGHRTHAPVAMNEEEWKDFGWRATHLMTVFAKRFCAEYYGKAPHHSYFTGGSTGGGQAMHEAVRFPDDYDGVVAVVPAQGRVALEASLFHRYKMLVENGKPILSTNPLQIVADAAIECMKGRDESYCAGKYLSDPRECEALEDEIFDLAARKDPVFALPDIRRRLHEIYSGPVVDGVRIHHGYPYGARITYSPGHFCFATHQLGIPGAPAPKNATWKDFLAFAEKRGGDLDALDPDMRRFAARGGKIISFVGFEDQTVPFPAALQHWEETAELFGGVDKVREFYRLYFLPGAAHGGIGRAIKKLPGYDGDVNEMLIAWAEKGKAPEDFVLKTNDGDTIHVAPYPEKASRDASGTWSRKPASRSFRKAFRSGHPAR